MTVTYSLDVAKATFGGFTKLLLRWRGSIYKILWKEFLVFCIAYALISVIYRYFLDSYHRDIFERVVVFVNTFSDLIPVSFVLGFYVSTVAGKWVNQYNFIPWPDKVSFFISSFVHGSDKRSRMIRRTLGRYLILMQVLTFQTVSTAVKRRFPTTQHLVDAGIMTKEEHSVYEKLDFPYGKWWLPCHWFISLATRAKKEGRIKDSILLNELLQEMMKFRDNCAIMIGSDWIGVPLVYTQVVTIATYLFAVFLLIGKQYIDPSKGYSGYPVDLYVPIFTLLQFFFYVGWLKVAEQILNPFGEDDDDFELNWILDRCVNQVYLTVDVMHMRHPKVKEDAFWSLTEINLPQTKHSARYLMNPDLGSAHALDVDEAEYLPLEELFEQDSEENHYKSESFKMKGAERQNSSFIRRVFNSGFRPSLTRKPRKPAVQRSLSCRQGVSNPAFSMADENEDDDAASSRSTPSNRRKSSLRNLVRKVSPASKRGSVKFRPNSMVQARQKSYDLEEADEGHAQNCVRSEDHTGASISRTVSTPAVAFDTESIEREDFQENFETNPEEHALDVLMPPIPEEASRANSLASVEIMAAFQRGETASQQMDKVHDLVKEASEVLQELSKSVAAQERWKENEGKGYESCCSGISSKESSESGSDEDVAAGLKREDVYVVIEDKLDEKNVSEKEIR